MRHVSSFIIISVSESIIQFTESVDDRRMLLVELSLDKNNSITITKWNLIASSDWSPDNKMNVWLGS